jgi:hypothetical protein
MDQDKLDLMKAYLEGGNGQGKLVGIVDCELREIIKIVDEEGNKE